MSRGEPVDQWLGSVPEDWKLLRLRHVLARNDSGVWGDEGGPGDTIVLRSTEQTADGRWRIEDPARRKLSGKEEVGAKLRRGDLVVTKSSGSAQHIGKTSLVDERVAALNCCFSNFMQRLAVRAPNEPRYFWYFLNQPAGREQLFYRSSTTTGLANLNGSVLGSVVAPVPAPEIQRAIASFLDRETARIDTLIEKKRRLLDLLEEKRRALIAHAVTRGLDPYVLMKDSGVEWIGEIPEHWEIVQVRRLLRRIEQGWSPQCENRQADAGEWGVLKAGCVNGGVFSEYEHKVLPATEQPKPELEIAAGEVLMSRASGSPDLIGSAAYVQESRRALMLSDKIFRLHTVDRLIEGEFLALALGARPVRAQIEQAISGAGGLANNISQASVRELQIALPPRLEQLKIVEYVRTRQRQLRQAENAGSTAVALLQEYRQALITGAVGGQIRVTEPRE